MPNKRIVFVIEVPGYVRHYFETAVFRDIKDIDFVVLAASHLRDQFEWLNADRDLKITYRRIGQTMPFRRSFFSFLSRLNMHRIGSINANFRFRLKRELVPGWLATYYKGRHVYRSRGALALVKLLFRRRKKLFKEIGGLFYLVTIACLSFLRADLLLRSLYWLLPGDKELYSAIRELRPELIVFPTVVVDTLAADIVRIAKRLSVPAMALVDNWDNLSSKSSFLERPDYVGVMGEQSSEFAQEFHGFAANQVFKLGNPRFEVYRDANLRPSRSKVGELPYILFAGCQVPFDETSAVEAVWQEFQLRKTSFAPGTYLRYRPHPFGFYRSHLRKAAERLEPMIQIDGQIRDFSSSSGSLQQLSLSEYPSILANASVVVTPLSTMLLEATLMGKKVIVLAHDDGISLLSPARMFSKYVHFSGIEALPNVRVVRSLGELSQAFDWFLDHPEFDEVPEQIEQFLEWRGGNYASRVGEAFFSCLSGQRERHGDGA